MEQGWQCGSSSAQDWGQEPVQTWTSVHAVAPLRRPAGTSSRPGDRPQPRGRVPILAGGARRLERGRARLLRRSQRRPNSGALSQVGGTEAPSVPRAIGSAVPPSAASVSTRPPAAELALSPSPAPVSIRSQEVGFAEEPPPRQDSGVPGAGQTATSPFPAPAYKQCRGLRTSDVPWQQRASAWSRRRQTMARQRRAPGPTSS